MPKNKEEFLATMRRRFAAAEEAESEIRREARIDLQFVAGHQWSEQDIAARKAANRPYLTFNRLPTFVHQVANEARQNKPQVKFSPAEDGDKDTAEIFEGLARRIQYASHADVAYETALEYAVSCGFGHFRMLTEFADKPGRPSNEQEIKFDAIVDPFSVYGCLLPRLKRQRVPWCFVIDTISKEDYEAEYPDSELTGQGFEWGSSVAGDWIGEDIRLAEYWHTEWKRRTWQTLSTGESVYRDQYKELPPGIEVVDERVVREPTIKFCKTNGVEILEETEWAGSVIPLFTVLGWQLVVDHQFELYSLVRFMRDPQKLVNFYKSGIAENIGLGNRAPYVGYLGQFKTRAAQWANANTVNYPYLEVDPVMIGGAPAPLPQRQQFEAAIQALSGACAQEIDDLKAIGGIFDASLGDQGNETSGIAIANRQRQSGMTNFHLVDNLARAQDDAGTELGYLIPRIYDTPRTIRILGEDETEKIVRVNAPHQDPETGEMVHYALTAGDYDVTVSTAPTYASKRQEAAATTAQVIQAAPQLMGVIGDIFFRNQDSPAADESAERVKKWIGLTMPGLIEDDKQKQQPIPPQVQAQLQQSGQMIEQLTQRLNELTDELSGKKLELESAERRVAMQEETKRTIALATLDQRDGVAMLQAEIAELRARLDREHEYSMAEADRQNQAQMARAGLYPASMPDGQPARADSMQPVGDLTPDDDNDNQPLAA